MLRAVRNTAVRNTAVRNAVRSASIVLLAWAMLPAPLLAQSGKTLRLVSGVTPGSASDTVARLLTDKLQAQLGQPVIVENRLGAGGVIAAAYVAKAEPDGNTVIVYTSAFTLAALINPGTLEPKDLAPVATLGTVPTVMVTAKPYKTLDELVAAARAKPEGVVAVSAGVGSSTHMNLERFRIAAGIKVLHVPTKGTNEALTEVLTGRADFYFSPVFAVGGQIKEGKMHALAMGSPARSSMMPGVATTVELGYPNSDYNFWIGARVSARTPRDVVARLNREFNAAVQAPDIRERYVKIGTEPLTMSVAEFEALVARELEANARIVKEAGIKAN
jgi:tripartite-type tricarboxylate transporter receptor subunit TctC